MSEKTRGILIAGNWKMNLGLKETEKFFSDLASQAGSILSSASLRAAVFPPMLSLQTAQNCAKETRLPLIVGAQNVHWEKSGAYTGEISGPMAQELGIQWALVGHSERRQYFGETDETARKRTESLLTQGFQVILCIGETRAEREKGETQAVILRQMDGVLTEKAKGAAAFLDGRLIIAYEPVWAIGTGLTATPEQAEEAHRMIRKHLGERFGMEASSRTPILYGGSVTPQNVDSLLECANVDGALVGGASLKPESFLTLLAAGAKALST